MSDQATRNPAGHPMLHRSVMELEADLAFFEARLALIEKAPETLYKQAQVRTYQLLGQTVAELLNQIRRQQRAAS